MPTAVSTMLKLSNLQASHTSSQAITIAQNVFTLSDETDHSIKEEATECSWTSL